MKKHIHYVQLCLISFFFVMAFFFNGCSIFSSIGDTVSQGYENMVSYFNGYYNAKKLFSEAEDEIKTAALLMRGKEVPAAQANQIPSTAKQKLGQVIDKCSNILAFHSSSSLVDNALLLIGRSFFYQMEYLKAEKKFAELLVQFPNSSLALEAQLWYARSEEKLGKFNDGIRLSDAAILVAQTSHDNEIETQFHQLLGVLYRRLDQTDKSIAEYEKAISISTDDDAKGDAQMSLGDIYFSGGQYKKAAEVYLKTEDYTSDIYSNYYCKLQTSIAYRDIGENEKELSLLNSMIDDFRNRDYLASIRFERANNYAASGRRDDAINEYIYVDTSYVHTEYAVRSAYQLGAIFEKECGNYRQALKYYSEVNTAAGPSIVVDGRRKFTALTRYFNARHQLNTADSLFSVLSDTTRKIISDSLNTIATDSIRKIITDSLNIALIDSKHQKAAHVDSFPVISNIDSIKTKSSILDTVRQKPVRVAAQPKLPSADSLHLLKSIAAQELGDIFYSEVVEPDSAFYWYNQSLLWNYNFSRSPRILYILAELSRMNPEKKFPAPEEYYSRLDHDFTESIYAEEARRFLRKTSSTVKTDTASEYYAQSEKQLDAKQYEKAIGTLRFIIQSFPKSPFAAKSEYAIGWIMENSLAQPDSAMAHYRRIVKDYKGTMYALAASKRSLEVLQSDTAKTDSAKVKNNSQTQKSLSTDNVRRNLKGLETDTTKAKNISPIQKPLSPDSIQRNLKGFETDTAKTKNIPPIKKLLSPDSVQRNLKGLETDTTKTKNIPSIQKSSGSDSIQRYLIGLERDTTKTKNVPSIQKSFGPDSVQR
jgi:tetratricopeptide (TPR) repeat protein